MKKIAFTKQTALRASKEDIKKAFEYTLVHWLKTIKDHYKEFVKETGILSFDQYLYEKNLPYEEGALALIEVLGKNGLGVFSYDDAQLQENLKVLDSVFKFKDVFLKNGFKRGKEWYERGDVFRSKELTVPVLVAVCQSLGLVDRYGVLKTSSKRKASITEALGYTFKDPEVVDLCKKAEADAKKKYGNRFKGCEWYGISFNDDPDRRGLIVSGVVAHVSEDGGLWYKAIHCAETGGVSYYAESPNRDAVGEKFWNQFYWGMPKAKWRIVKN